MIAPDDEEEELKSPFGPPVAVRFVK